jgi:D-beta-D-heptose 7-phosphate kinase/D-beta-D-heptose 1-phosphate adenosyltransferase
MTESATIQQPKSFKILLIGDNCTDVYQYGTVDRISPEAPIPVFVPSYKEERHGMAGNVFNNLEALGCEVEYLFGETSTKTRLIDARSKQQIVRIDNDVKSSPIQFETAIPDIYDAIVISDYCKGTISYELVEEIIKEVKCPVFIDTKKHDLARFEGAVIKINAQEFSQLVSKPSSRNLIVTQGDKGVLWDGWAMPPDMVEVADVCGAGDTFLAALVYSYLDAKDMRTAIRFAIKAAGISVQHIGCYAPRLEELI